MVESSLLRMYFYHNSDGPRVMLFGPMGVNLNPLHGLFRDLSHGLGPFDLEGMSFCYRFGDVRIRLQCRSNQSSFWSSGQPEGLRIVSEVGPDFFWVNSEDSWDFLAELTQSLVESMEPGHQYLTGISAAIDDATIVLSRGEYQDDDFG